MTFFFPPCTNFSASFLLHFIFRSSRFPISYNTSEAKQRDSSGRPRAVARDIDMKSKTLVAYIYIYMDRLF